MNQLLEELDAAAEVLEIVRYIKAGPCRQLFGPDAALDDIRKGEGSLLSRGGEGA